MLNLTTQRWKASAKVEQNLITTKHAHKLFYAKTKIIPEIAEFDMQKWQNRWKHEWKLSPPSLFFISHSFSGNT